jgi:MFS family permease
MTAITGTVALTTIASLGVAFSDVLVDAIVVAKSRGGDQGKAGALQSLCWSSVSIGGLLSAYFSGSFVEDFGPTFVFALTAVFPLITAGVSLLIDEKPVAKAAAPAAVTAAGAKQVVPVGDEMAFAAAQGEGVEGEEGGIATIKRQFGALW